jgi:hypothetical protein
MSDKHKAIGERLPSQRLEEVNFDPSKGFPAARNLVYRCSICREDVPSLPSHSIECSCGNVRIDIDAGRMAVNQVLGLRLFKVARNSRRKPDL